MDAWKGCGEPQELTKGSGHGRMAGTYRTLAYPGNERRAVCIGVGWGCKVEAGQKLRDDTSLGARAPRWGSALCLSPKSNEVLMFV